MKSQRNVFKWIGMAFLFAVFMSFTLFLPLASAQEGGATTPTPSDTPLPEATPEPLEIPEI